jgi:phosphate transport system protein
MPQRLQRQIEKLKKSILSLGADVEKIIRMALEAIENHDVKLAEQVIEMDKDIDQKEIDLEEDGLKILALYQPVAIDLRYIIAVLKINSDLERMGDLAVNIAERAHKFNSNKNIHMPPDIKLMGKKVQDMVQKSLDCLVNKDADLASEIGAEDDEVDDLNRKIVKDVGESIKKEPNKYDALIELIVVSRSLERIADHATNIGEDVVYMMRGEIIRHGKGQQTE